MAKADDKPLNLTDLTIEQMRSYIPAGASWAPKSNALKDDIIKALLDNCADLTVAKLEDLCKALKIPNKLQLVTAVKKFGKPPKPTATKADAAAAAKK